METIQETQNKNISFGILVMFPSLYQDTNNLKNKENNKEVKKAEFKRTNKRIIEVNSNDIWQPNLEKQDNL